MATLRFAYTGRASGATVNGELDAPDAAGAAALLQGRGVLPIKIEPLSASVAAARSSGRAGSSWGRPRIKIIDLMLFTRQLHTLLRAGVPILRALSGLRDSSINPAMRQMLADVRHSLESGIELSRCLAQHPKVFDPFYVAMVRMGEMTGHLDGVLKRLFDHIEFENFMQQQVKSALRYPSFVVLSMVAAVAVINLMVIPSFTQVFKAFGAQLPWATRLLLGFSEFTVQWGWAIGAAAVGAAFAFKAWARTPQGELTWDRWKLRLPLAGPILLKAALARFARSFALALKSGVPVEQALQVVALTVDNAHISGKVDSMRDAVSRGDTILRAATATGVFTPVVLQMVAVGEETSALDELLDEIAQLYNNEVQYDLKSLSQQIEPILIVFLGVMVLVLAMGVFLPLWDLGSVALKK
jgi:MSHA biogenesis protein MshG